MPQPPLSIPFPETPPETPEERNRNPYIVAAILALSIVVLLFYRLSGSQVVPQDSATMVGVQNVGHSNLILVDVDGAVVRPGVYRLKAGSRVFDAIASAGGLKPEADKLQVNMAQKLRDEQKLIVPTVGQVVPGASATPEPGESPSADVPADVPADPPDEMPVPPEEEPVQRQPLPSLTPAAEITPTSAASPVALHTPKPETPDPAVPGPVSGPAPAPSPAVKISVNRATAEQLQSIPGLGPKLAMDIVNYRKGPPPHAFTSLDELTSVPTIKQGKFEEILPYLKL